MIPRMRLRHCILGKSLDGASQETVTSPWDDIQDLPTMGVQHHPPRIRLSLPCCIIFPLPSLLYVRNPFPKAGVCDTRP